MTQRQLMGSTVQLAPGARNLGGPADRLAAHAENLVHQRLALGAGLMAGLSLVHAAAWLVLQPQLRAGPALPEVLGLLLLGLFLDATLLVETAMPTLSRGRLGRLGEIYHVLRTFTVALYSVRIEWLLGWPPSLVTLASATIAVFPLLVPTPPLRLLGLSLVAGGTVPLVYWLHGVTGGPLLLATFLVAVSVAIAGLFGRVAQGLSVAVARGDHLGPYRLLSPLSKGGGGGLWIAEHRLLARPAAVKTIRPRWLPRRRVIEHLARFQREAQVATRLTSPHSVIVYEYGVADDGSLFYVREFLDGESLEQRVRRAGKLPTSEVVRIALEVCDSLAEAHALGLVHRRLGPRQIFLCRIGRRTDFVKVLDFGLLDLQQTLGARLPLPQSTRRSAGAAIDCIAPETLQGRPPDERSDIYQLGGVMEFLRKGGNGGEPEDALLTEIVARCLSPDPAQRYSSVGQLQAALGRVALRPHSRRSEEGHEARHWTRGTATGATRPPLGIEPEAELPGSPGAGPSAVKHRLERFSGLLLVATLVLCILMLGLAPASDRAAWAVRLAPLLLATGLLDTGVLVAARDRRIGSVGVQRLALVYVVLRAMTAAALGSEVAVLLGRGVSALSFAPVLVIVLPFLLTCGAPALMTAATLAALAAPATLLWAGAPGSLVAASIVHASVVTGATYGLVGLVAQMRRSRSSRTFGAYRLVRLLAHGAMGEVWQAEHELLARPAAVKLIASRERRRSRADAMRRRFVQEAQVTARLTSPHSVTLFDYGVTEEDVYYYVMELLEGQDLQRQVERDGPLSWQEAVSVALQICDSLAEAHALGLVHRDLKPANLFMARVGQRDDFVKVLDFGLADVERQARWREGGTLGPVVGTPGYIAPEVLIEQGADARSDIYQLGCVLFFLLSGRPVFEGLSATALAVAHVRDTPPRVSSVTSASLPSELVELVARCLAKSPEDRFASVAEVEQRLSSLRIEPNSAAGGGGLRSDASERRL